MNTLDKEFHEAYIRISNEARNLAPDIMLRIYAYYKQATNGLSHRDFQDMSTDLKKAFKFNAWTQISHLSATQAKEEYIKLAKQILDNPQDDE
ncbi:MULTISPECIES: acyl-CoA-binding protein [Myroides]|uniref:Phosphatidylserine decarboxylase n=1 Tax=Myroides albus TaxID=2562892 RepID=A0A6I3LJH8_9FLAO|nr:MULTISPECIES: acyl-CoA-binding protein [Myroides]MTG97997.1 phosphatidylserine decarboxylase [Myroides albus]MVX34854.1 phosphatidylserine decarboxylase [Myroides sp. LoEW2-1]UVD80288.1 acyl-CoA-binding protein [Myroides albus]